MPQTDLPLCSLGESFHFQTASQSGYFEPCFLTGAEGRVMLGQLEFGVHRLERVMVPDLGTPGLARVALFGEYTRDGVCDGI